jgi:hypothetical protein
VTDQVEPAKASFIQEVEIVVQQVVEVEQEFGASGFAVARVAWRENVMGRRESVEERVPGSTELAVEVEERRTGPASRMSIEN